MKSDGFKESRNVVVVSPPMNGMQYDFLSEMLSLHYIKQRDRWLVELEKEEVEGWISENLPSLNGRRVLLLSDTALLVPKPIQNLIAWRGSALPVGQAWAVHSFHPASIFAMPEKSASKERREEGATKYTYGTGKFTLGLDIAKCLRRPDAAFQSPERNLIVQPSWETWQDIKKKIQAAPMVSFDVETKGNWVDLLGFGWSATEAVSLPMRESHWGAEWPELLWDVQNVFDVHPHLIAHNGSFDRTLLEHNKIHVPFIWMDTLIAHHWLWCELPHSLAYLTSIYTNEPYYKDTIETEREIYNAKDCAVTWEIADQLLKEMSRKGLQERFFSFVMPLAEVVHRMGERGVAVDSERIGRLQRALEYLIERGKRNFNRMAGKEINLASPKQVGEYLYTDLKLPPQLHRKTKKPTTDEEAINKLAKKYNRPGLKQILKVRDFEKKKGTYAEVTLDSDGRLRTLLNVAGTDTGRLSSKQTYFDTGWNSQNCPPWFRKNILPDPGKELLSGDLSGADARFFAWEIQEKQMIEVFNDPEGDIHCFVASKIAGCPYKPVDKKRPERARFKKVVHAFDYGLGANHAAEMIGCSVADGKKYKELYYSLFPRVPAYHKELKLQLSHNRRMTNALGRQRVFLGRLTEDLFRKAVAWGPQGSVADYLDQGLVEIAERAPDWLDYLLQVHDELVFQCPPERVPEAIEFITKYVCVPVLIHGVPLVVPLEFKVGPNWGEMEAVKIA